MQLKTAIAFTCLLVGSTLIAQDQNTAAMVISLEIPVKLGTASQPFELQITLRNTAKTGYYVCGRIDLYRLDSICGYDLEVRAIRTTDFVKTQKFALDPPYRPYGSAPTLSDFLKNRNIFILEPNHSLTAVVSGSWKGLTTLGPGRYEVRLVHPEAASPPVALDRFFFKERSVSNIVSLEILP